MDITIRPFTAADKPVYVAFYSGIYKHIAKIDPYQRQDWNAQNQEILANEEFDEVFEHEGQIFVACSDDEVIGMCMVSIPPDSRFLQKVRLPARSGKINILFVKDTYRGKGIGQRLLTAGEAYLIDKGCEYIDLVVFATNDLAHGMYKRNGYQDISIDMTKKV